MDSDFSGLEQLGGDSSAGDGEQPESSENQEGEEEPPVVIREQVMDVDLDRGAHVVQFDGVETPRKISFRAKLERIESGN